MQTNKLEYYLDLLLNQRVIILDARFTSPNPPLSSLEIYFKNQALIENALINEIKKISKNKYQKEIGNLINIPYFYEEKSNDTNRVSEMINDGFPVIYVCWNSHLYSLTVSPQEENSTLFIPYYSITNPIQSSFYIFLNDFSISINAIDFNIRFDFDFENECFKEGVKI